MDAKGPSLDGIERVLEELANDPRLPGKFPEWIRESLKMSGAKIEFLRYIFRNAPPGNKPPRVLDVGAQTGAFAVYAAELGCRVAAVDYGSYSSVFGAMGADHGVDYRQCDVRTQPLPFADNSFDFVTYTDVIEHHSFSPKRILREIHRVLAPGGRLILTTPNHASIYNRSILMFGGSVNDTFDYFFDVCADEDVYPGHHREYTRGEVRMALESTKFRVRECRVSEEGDMASLLYYLRRHRSRKEVASQMRALVVGALGWTWTLLHLPFGRWIWAVGEKPVE
jgi:SAM-dependent methyltransferase